MNSLKDKKKQIALKMPVKELVKEHTDLVKALKTDNPKLIHKEAKEQSKELKGYKKLI
jgi:hypothetical protein